MYSYDEDEDGLGLALPAVGSAISLVGGIFKGSKDPGRLAANLKAYTAAMAGATTFTSGSTTMNPVEFLRQKSIPGGWATEVARADAERKYKAVLAAKKPGPTGAGTGATGGINPIGASPPDPRQALGAISGGLPLILAGVVVAVALSSRRR